MKDYIEKSKKIANIDYKLDMFRIFLENYQPRDLDISNRLEILNNDEITVFFSDLHIGKKSTDKVLERLKKMTLDLVNRPERKINLICL